ncbi:MAG TPA: hypothetical protein VFL57_21180 [Bryobacteraceae bacterium]|nr:hypothetical protein [Bryobacteraceae bacterium]
MRNATKKSAKKAAAKKSAAKKRSAFPYERGSRQRPESAERTKEWEAAKKRR